MTALRQVSNLGAFIRGLSVLTLIWTLLVLVGLFVIFKLSGPNELALSYAEHKNYRLTELLEETKRHNSELKKLIENYLSKNSAIEERLRLLSNMETKSDQKSSNAQNLSVKKVFVGTGFNPTIEHEQLRRRIRSNIAEMHNYIISELTKMSKHHTLLPELTKTIDGVLHMTSEHKNSLLNDMDQLQQMDDHDQWRFSEVKSLSDLVQRRLKHLQNPKDCSRARKLVCRIKQECGFGCQTHHVVFCLMIAYATERTLILKSEGWGYHSNGWNDIFKPLSETCTTSDGLTYQMWENGNNGTQVLELPTIHILDPPPKQLPLAIPEDLAPRLKRLHGDPFVWWAGQFVKYVVRFQPETQAIIESNTQKVGFQRPIVGVHIRRTDKIGTEAAFHTVEEYMEYVDEYYDQLEMVQHVRKRRIFLASDEIMVIDEARKKYPNYEIIGDSNAARIASIPTRYTDSSLYGILLDIHLLSQSDYLVCTFSSQVCRVAYELMQTLHPDASQRFKSLDDIYFFAGQNDHNRIAVLPHHPPNNDEIEMNVGDLIGIAGNHWNGFSKGRNTRTNQIGIFPSFKTIDTIETAKFPEYSNVK